SVMPRHWRTPSSNLPSTRSVASTWVLRDGAWQKRPSTSTRWCRPTLPSTINCSTGGNLLLEGQGDIRFELAQRRPELLLDARQPFVGVGFEAQHNDRGRVRRPGQTEAVFIFGAHAVDRDELRCSGEAAFLLQPGDQRVWFAFLHLDLEFRCGAVLRQCLQHGRWVVVRR